MEELHVEENIHTLKAGLIWRRRDEMAVRIKDGAVREPRLHRTRVSGQRHKHVAAPADQYAPAPSER